MRDATVAIEAMKRLSDTNHYTLADSHFWDIALAIKDVARPENQARRKIQRMVGLKRNRKRAKPRCQNKSKGSLLL